MKNITAALVSLAMVSVSTASAQSLPLPQPQPIVLGTTTGPIYGTLQLADCKSNCAVALIIAGSGPTDRDGNSLGLPGANNSLKMLAESLAANDIASIRYDKRGVAASARSMTGEADLRFTTYVDDAAGWIRFLRNNKRFNRVTVIGHSEGSLIGMLAANAANADKFVSIAGTGRPAGTVILEQLAAQLPPPLLEQSERIIMQINAGKTPDSVPQVLFALFRPSVIPYMISWFPLDPARELARLRIPVLILQGSTDIQVNLRDANLLGDAKPAARLVIVDGMNHVLKDATSDRTVQMKAYSDPSLPINTKLISTIVSFIKGK